MRTGKCSPTFRHWRVCVGGGRPIRLRLGIPGILPRAGGCHCRAVQFLLLCRAMPLWLTPCTGDLSLIMPDPRMRRCMMDTAAVTFRLAGARHRSELSEAAPISGGGGLRAVASICALTCATCCWHSCSFPSPACLDSSCSTPPEGSVCILSQDLGFITTGV
jgi:hypothetical protein